MNTHIRSAKTALRATAPLLLSLLFHSCSQEPQKADRTTNEIEKTERPDYFLLRPKLEKTYGYTQAVRVGNLVKIGGIISIDEKGNPTAKNDYRQQMKNCYASLDKILKHYGCTYDDVILENIYTTNMGELHKNASYRKEIYKKTLSYRKLDWRQGTWDARNHG
ncbi:RidA family protein [Chryseobacterium camelliae]|uniref:RidA family protein n=1 Tax=Chryseobacterium camelliae TaxID=1265445 RepID=UPI003002832B